MKNATPRWRRWLKRAGLVLLGLLAILVLFHRPIIFEGTRYFVVRAAKQQHLDIDYKISGSIFSTLSITNLRGRPTESGPIQRLEIGTINLRYSLWGLIRKGMPALLRVVDIRDVFVEITPGESPPPQKAQQSQQVKFPALFPELLNLENINFVSHAPGGDTRLEGLFFSLLPDRPGVLKIRTLDVPGVRRWEGIAGRTTFRDRNLVLTDLAIGPEIALRRLNLDASRLDDAKLGLGFEGALFGAETTLQARITDLNAANHLDLEAACAGLDFDAAWKYLNLAVPLRGVLTSLAVDFHGPLEKPSDWTGKIDTQLDHLTLEPQPLGAVTISARLADGRGDVLLTNDLDERNQVRLQATAALPATLDGFPNADVAGRLDVKAPDLATLTRLTPQPLHGDVMITTDFRLHERKLAADAKLDSGRLAASGAELTRTGFTLHLEKDLAAKPGDPPFATLVTRLEGGVASLRFQDYSADAFSVALATRDAQVTLENLSLTKAGNSVRVAGGYVLPRDLRRWEQQPLDLDLNVDAPTLQAFAAGGADLRGSLKVTGKATARDRVYDGDFVIAGRDISAQGLTVRTVDGNLRIVKGNARLSQLDLVLDDQNTLHASGDVQLSAPYPYRGSVEARLRDLSRFQPLLGQNGQQLAGSLVLDWQGSGDSATPQHTGAANLDLTSGQYGAQKNLTAHLAATYSPEFINVPDLRVAAGDLGDAALSLFWRANRLQVSRLAVRQQRLTLLEGRLDVPLVLAQASNPDRLFPNDQPLDVSLRTRDLNLRALFGQLGQKPPPVTGTVNLDIAASGTLDALLATTSLRATRLQSTAAEQFDPADVALDARLRDRRLTVDGTVRQRLIQPLQITAALPLDVPALKRNGRLDPATPLNARVTLPRSSLAFVSTLVPAVRQSRGTAAIDVRVGGTLEKPAIDGSLASDLEILRFTDPSLPPIDRFGLRIAFTRDRMRIEQCRGGIAGGSFAASGGIDFTRTDNPILDLRLGTRNALVLQNDDVTARVSSDLRVSGPLNAGTVAGTVFVTKSRFFKDIDILPIGLPGRPAPQPPAEPSVVSFPNPPLRDWKFDVAIRTTPDDPFLVQGNLANGRVSMDLRLGGTGLDPWMDGSVRIEQLTASLPFSRLQIESGIVYFTRDSPFVPRLNLRGTSTVRDYDVQVYIYGPATDPQAVFSSDPPLPQSEVVALLATGTTTSELSRDPNALAGRAAVLAFQKLYRSVFRRNRPAEPPNDSFLNRIQFDIGATDPKTGKQSATARIPLSERFALLGGLDVGGNFRGQVKYFLRFK